MAKEKQHKILIVGAGLGALTLAAQLLRNGIIPIVIDAQEGFEKTENYTLISNFTLGVFKQLEIGENVKPLNHIQVIGESQNVKIELEEPFFVLNNLLLKQQLLNFLTFHTCSVNWKTQLNSLKKAQNGQFEVILLKKENPVNEVIDFVVFTNDELSEKQFFYADVKAKTASKTHDLQLFITAKKSFFGLPVGDEKLKLIGEIPLNTTDDKDALKDILNNDFELINYQLIKKEQQEHLFINDERIFNLGKKHLFLDHVFSDESILNAHNLAWKLAGVVKGHQKAGILETYQQERHPNHQHHFALKNQLLKALFSDRLVYRTFRKYGLLSAIATNKKLKKQFEKISPADVDYRNSALSLHLSQADRIKAGDKLPNLKFVDEKTGEEIYLHSWCKKPGFTILILGTYNNQSLLAMARFVQLNYPYKLNLYYLPFSKKNKAVFEVFEIPDGRKKCVIVRPDLFIGLLSDLTDIEQIGQYFNDFALLNPSKKVE